MNGRLRQRGENVWELSFDAGRDASGKRIRRFSGFQGTRKQAEQALRELIYKWENGTGIEPNRITVPEYLERWLTDYAETAVAPSTLVRYRIAVRKHIAPHLGGIKLNAIRPAHIQAMHAKCRAEGLKPRTISQHHRIIREALQHAVKWQLLALNPADAVDPPRCERVEMNVLSGDQVRVLLEKSADSFIGPIVYMALQTGARSGELLALRWSDIDVENRRMSIVRTVQRLPGQGLVFRPTKTHRSRRSLTLSPETLKFLKEHRARQAEMRLQLGPVFTDQGLVFPQVHGGPYEPGQVSHAFDRLLRAVKLPDIRFHDLRHTAATLLLSAKIHPKVVSERLGHASIHITLDTYSHVVPDLQDEAAAAMDGMLKVATQPDAVQPSA